MITLKQVLITIVFITFLAAFMIRVNTIVTETKSRTIKVIDLPEEIQLAKETDTLIGYIRDDTLFIKFNHKY